MAQVIEVLFLNDENINGEPLHDGFTKASSHQEAIELALTEWSGGAGVLKRIERDTSIEVTHVGSGANRAWKYVYTAVVEGPVGGDDDNREMTAVLFTQYKEKE